MKLLADKVLLGLMTLSLALSGGLLLPSAVRAADMSETPIKSVGEIALSEVTAPVIAPTKPTTVVSDMSETMGEAPAAVTPESVMPEPEVAQMETSQLEETPKPKNQKGLKILFGILQLLGKQLK